MRPGESSSPAQTTQLGSSRGRIWTLLSHPRDSTFPSVGGWVFAALRCEEQMRQGNEGCKSLGGAPGSGMSPWVTWIQSTSAFSGALKAATFFPQFLKLFGNGWFEIFGSCSSKPRYVTFSGKMCCNYSNPTPNNWGCALHGPSLCLHRFDFIYDLFEHISSRNNQDTLKCGSKHRRPTVSSQFKVSVLCWP